MAKLSGLISKVFLQPRENKFQDSDISLQLRSNRTTRPGNVIENGFKIHIPRVALV
jgi:hypothetical protein